ncbi:MAG: arginine--tRNA ligase, partial [Clostridia bacterium]|nr:arginine--tRNA ligase [Clostridia bacterium]
EGDRWGNGQLGSGQKVQVEFVSANPTGLLHMGNARGAALGDTLANLLEACGYTVTREFYINDAGHQIEAFAASLEARYLQLFGHAVPLPDEGYHGEDLRHTVRSFADVHGDRYVHASPEERRQALVTFALEEKLAEMRRSLARFGVEYDVWFSEKSLHARGAVREAIAALERKGYIYQEDGALWFRASALSEAKDEVVVRSSGVPTYFAADIAYHQDKFARGFDWVINIWGADHHGHVGRLKAALAALGYDPARLTVIIMQLVRLFQGGELLRMSKRTGQYVTLD